MKQHPKTLHSTGLAHTPITIVQNPPLCCGAWLDLVWLVNLKVLSLANGNRDA